MPLEHELRRALRAEDPGDAFTARVLSRIQAEQATRTAAAAPETRGPAAQASEPAAPIPWPGARPRPGRATDAAPPDVTAPPRTRARWVWVSTLAASLLVSAAGGAQWMKHRQEMADGARARAEVLAALRLTSEKLSLVRTAVTSGEAPR